MTSRTIFSGLVALLCASAAFIPTEAKAVEVAVHVNHGYGYGYGHRDGHVEVRRYPHGKRKFRRVWVPGHAVWRHHHKQWIPGHYELRRVYYR